MANRTYEVMYIIDPDTAADRVEKLNDAVGKLIEKELEGLYFPGLGKYDLTGDGVEDIILISNSESIPEEADKEEIREETHEFQDSEQEELEEEDEEEEENEEEV